MRIVKIGEYCYRGDGWRTIVYFSATAGLLALFVMMLYLDCNIIVFYDVCRRLWSGLYESE